MGEKGQVSVVVSEVGTNGAVFPASSCNYEVSGGWVAAELYSLVHRQPTSRIGHRALLWLLTLRHK